MRKRRSKITYSDKPMFLDIETSHNHDQENPICWIVSIQVLFDGAYHIYRTPEEFIEYMNSLIKRMNLNTERRLVIYIHNASYDLSYLLPYIQRFIPGKDERHCIMHGEHKIIQYYQGGLEFRCSYLLSGVSLERWSKDMNIEHQKKIGLYNYDAIIYQDSELSVSDLTYDEYDVLAMEECFEKQLDAHGDDIRSVPLTSTGYSRRLLRTECEKDTYYRREYFKDNQLELDPMLFCLEGYAGGYTHNNARRKSKVQISYKMQDDIINGLIKHKDFRSHYPTQLRYPMPYGKTELYYDIRDYSSYRALHNKDINIADLIDMYPDYFCMCAIRIENMFVRSEEITMPFMQKSKMKDCKLLRDIYDNGRLVSAIGSFTTYVDNLTLKILRDQYIFDYKVIQVYRFKMRPCPKPIATVIDKLFKDKSDYKILWKKYQKEYGEFHEKTVEAAFKLMQAKKLLNSIYGCFATNPLRSEYDLDFENYNELGELDPFLVTKSLDTTAEKAEALNEFYNKRSSFLHYPVGVACTAAARYELYEYIVTIGYDRVLYCDTDSIFYLTTPEIEEKVEALNAEKNKTAPYITNINGEKIYYNVFEDEPNIIAFKGLHSKCYGYVTESNELKLVVAGVPERTLIGLDDHNEPIYLTREEEIMGITKELKLKGYKKKKKKQKGKFLNKKIRRNIDFLNRLNDNKEFHVNTGVTARYITSEPHIEVVNGHKVSTAGGCIINKLETKLVHDMDFTDDVTIQFYDYYGE